MASVLRSLKRDPSLYPLVCEARISLPRFSFSLTLASLSPHSRCRRGRLRQYRICQLLSELTGTSQLFPVFGVTWRSRIRFADRVASCRF